jgi:hypothetical protein
MPSNRPDPQAPATELHSGSLLGDTQPAVSRPQKRALPGSRYTDQEIERGLVALALFSGNRRRASEALDQQGLSIPDSTLRDWRETYSGWYTEVQRKTMPQIRELAAEQHSDLAQLEGGAARKLLDRLIAKYQDIPARDLPGAIRNLDVSAAVNRDKAAMLRGENPEAQSATRSVKDILGSLQAKAPHLFDNGRLTVEWRRSEPEPDAIEGTATEQPE